MPGNWSPLVAMEHSGTEEVDDSVRRGTPLTVLTGALGAGKTTLLKYVLGSPHGYRIAVVQNEFSEEMGIESPLITDSTGETFKDIIELPNGCLCCSAKDGLVSALDRLLEETGRFDYVLVEATGIADPEQICEIFWVDDELGSKVYLDSIVTLVDCYNVMSVLGETSVAASSAGGYGSMLLPLARAGGHAGGDMAGLGLEAESSKQLACADVLVLNKVDLVPDASIRSRIARRVKAINPSATILESSHASVPLGSILGIRAFERKHLVDSLANLSAFSCEPCGHASPELGCRNPTCGTDHGDSDMNAYGSGNGHIFAPEHGIESVLLRGDSESTRYDPAKVQAWLVQVLWEGVGGSVFRGKGLFKGPSEDDASCEAAHSVQIVGKIFEVEEAPQSVVVAQSKLLLIGRGLNREALEQGWRSCMLSTTADDETMDT